VRRWWGRRPEGLRGELGASPQVREVVLEDDGSVLLALVQRPNDARRLEHPPRLPRRGSRTVEQRHDAVHFEDWVLGQTLKEPQAEHGRVVAGEQPPSRKNRNLPSQSPPPGPR